MTTETLFGRDVTLEDGLVVLPAGKNRRAIWVQCPTCGPQPPATAWNKARECHATVTHTQRRFSEPLDSPRILSCSLCGRDAPSKEILIPREQKDRLVGPGLPQKCTNRCLDGKTFCACACRGRCHSEGRCYCAASTGKARG